MNPEDELTTVARADGPRGEVVLRRRGHGEQADWELIINGTFAMDSVETTSEQALAELPFDHVGARVLLGGLGLGYTADALLQTSIAALTVVELESALIDWARAGLLPVGRRIADDPQVSLVSGDVADFLTDPANGPWRAILLDVDNGPDFLIHETNAGLYAAAGIAAAVRRLEPGGVLAVWCQGPAEELLQAMRGFGATRIHTYRVQRGRRTWSYVIYTVTVPGSR